jgi:chloramphenicol O-acetyltransferase
MIYMSYYTKISNILHYNVINSLDIMVIYLSSKDNKKNSLISFNKTISIHINKKSPIKMGLYIKKQIILLK